MFEFLAGLFLIGSLGFWVVTLTLFCVIIALTENERDWSAAILIAMFIGCVEYFPEKGFFDGMTFISLFEMVGLYAAIGLGWSFGKWYFFVQNKYEGFIEHRDKWLNRHNDNAKRVQREVDNHPEDFENVKIPQIITDVNDLSEDQREQLKEYLYDRGFISYRADTIIPSVKDNKARMTRWIIWWPFSTFWTLLNDPIRKLANRMVDMFGGVYNGIAKRVFHNVEL